MKLFPYHKLIWLLCSFAFITFPIKAQELTRIKFARGSYCGSYAGDFYTGRDFVLNLRSGQTLTARNIGGGQQYNVYIYGPSGTISGRKIALDQINYQIPQPGDYYIHVESTTTYNSIEFCAY